MLLAGAVLPHPPLLIPGVASGASAELDDVRAASERALRSLIEVDPELVVVVGTGAVEYAFARPAKGSLAGYGLQSSVRWPHQSVSDRTPVDAFELPLSLTVAAWLLNEARFPDNTQLRSVPRSLSLREAGTLGESLASSSDRVCLVAMGDGSSCLTEKSPGYLVPGAMPWHDRVAQALGAADREALLTVTAEEATEFGAAGLVPWWVLAGAAGEGQWAGELLADTAPYGVGYLVASWRRVLP